MKPWFLCYKSLFKGDLKFDDLVLHDIEKNCFLYFKHYNQDCNLCGQPFENVYTQYLNNLKLDPIIP